MATIQGPWNHGSPFDPGDRKPPQNLEAEMGLLGSILRDPSILAEVREILRGPEDFFRDDHQVLYRAILDVADQGRPVDPITLAEELTRRGLLDDAGGLALIEAVVESVPFTANSLFYAGIVRDKAILRDLIEYAAETLRDGYSGKIASAVALESARRKLARVEHDARGELWQAPDLDAVHPAVPFPLDALPPGLRRFVLEVSRSVPCPPDFVAVPALAVAGAAVGRSVALRVKPGWHEEGNLWAAIIGPPGSGKTPPLKAVTRPLYKIFEKQLRLHQAELDAAKAARRAAEAERKKLAGKPAPGADLDDPPPTLKRVLVGDVTAEALGSRLRDNPRGLVLVLDELAGMINGLNQYKTGGNDQEFYLALWSRASYPIDRKGQDGAIPIYVRSPFFAMTGGIQPDKLEAIGTSRDGQRVNDGFLDRFLFAFPREVPMRWTDDEVSEQTESDWAEAVGRLWDRAMVPDDEGYERPFVVEFTADARDRFAEWFDSNCLAMQEADFPEELKGPHSKVRAYCARLALVVDQLWRAFDPDPSFRPEGVSLASVEAAIALVEYFESHYRRVVAFLSGSWAENQDAEAVLKWLRTKQDWEREPGRFSAKDVLDNFRKRFRAKPDVLDAALRWLEERRVIKKGPEQAVRTGRPRAYPVYDLNPILLGKAREMRETPSS